MLRVAFLDLGYLPPGFGLCSVLSKYFSLFNSILGIHGWPIATAPASQPARTRPDLLVILKPFKSVILEFVVYFFTMETLLRGSLGAGDSLGEATNHSREARTETLASMLSKYFKTSQ